jgi:hypothetical protein
MTTAQNGTSEFLNFSDALNHLRWGERLARRQWRQGEWIQIDYNTTPTTIFFHDRFENEDDWCPSPRMLIAEDWYVVGEHQ